MLDGLHGLIKLIYDSAFSSSLTGLSKSDEEVSDCTIDILQNYNLRIFVLDGMIISGGKEDWKNI